MNQFLETVDIEEAAHLVKAEIDTIQQLARTGEIPGAKVGKSWVFFRSDVLAYLRKAIDDATELRRRTRVSTIALGVVVEKKMHGRSKPLPVLPQLSQ